ncbi:MAG: hypothetical protein GX666_10365, partial [Tissierellia bacterium]|nr:hypothetical protein [Tissierellia bacterium]
KINNPHILSTHDEEIIDQEDKRNIIAHVVVDGNVVKTNEDELEEISMIENMLKKEFGNCEYHIVIDRDYNKV